MAVVFLPNGAYASGRSTIHVNALSSPFSDYGFSEVVLTALMFALPTLERVRRRRGLGPSPWALVFVVAGVLGSLLPDSWLQNTISIVRDGTRETIAVQLQYGYWLNLALVAAILAISVALLWRDPHVTRRASLQRSGQSAAVTGTVSPRGEALSRHQ